METTQLKKVTKTLVYSCALAIGIVLFGVGTIYAASIYLSPASGSYSVGGTFGVSVYVTSADQAMNAASGILSFPRDKLEIISLTKTGSIISLWVQEPSFSNTVGNAVFEGIILNPGFTGSVGKILTINFRVKGSGLAPIIFSSGSVLANDGLGTNILTNLGNANFTLGTGIPSIPTIPVSGAGIPKAPTIISLTHPASDVWYAKGDAKFSWQLPSGTTGTRLLVGRNSSSIPTVTYTPAISSKEITDLGDGIWYFNTRLRNAQGWGESAHFKFQIDTEKPDYFNVVMVEREDPTTPTVNFVFDAIDATSGIDYYEVRIDENEVTEWRDDGTHVYNTPILAPGSHTIVVRAIDKAGNFLERSVKFSVEALEAPTITEYLHTVQSGEEFFVRGTTYSNIQITLFLEKGDLALASQVGPSGSEPLKQIGKSDESGNFVLVYKDFKSGIYTMWVEVIDERGAKSGPSEKYIVLVERALWSPQVIIALTILIPVIILIALLGILFWFFWRGLFSFRQRLYEEVYEAEEALHKAIGLFKKDTKERLKLLEKTKTKRKFTIREKRILRQMKEDLDDVEQLVRKEIKDIGIEIDRVYPKKKKVRKEFK